jgi:hypothetical protein
VRHALQSKRGAKAVFVAPQKKQLGAIVRSRWWVVGGCWVVCGWEVRRWLLEVVEVVVDTSVCSCRFFNSTCCVALCDVLG